MRFRKRYLVPLILAAPALPIWICYYPPVLSDVACFQMSPADGARVRLATKVDPRNGNLLVSFYDVGTMLADLKPWRRDGYLYDKQTGAYKPVPASMWDETPGNIVNGQAWSEDLLWKPGGVPAAGKKALWDFASQQFLTARVSANGYRRPKLREYKPSLPTMNPPNHFAISGQHFVEFFQRTPEYVPIGRPMRISLKGADGLDRGAWSLDGKYFILSTNRLDSICVIPVEEIVKE